MTWNFEYVTRTLLPIITNEITTILHYYMNSWCNLSSLSELEQLGVTAWRESQYQICIQKCSTVYMINNWDEFKAKVNMFLVLHQYVTKRKDFGGELLWVNKRTLCYFMHMKLLKMCSTRHFWSFTALLLIPVSFTCMYALCFTPNDPLVWRGHYPLHYFCVIYQSMHQL